MQVELPECLRFEGVTRQIVAEVVAGFERLEENLGLIGSRGQFEIDRYLHKEYSILEKYLCHPLITKEAAFLLAVNDEVSNARLG